MSKKNSQLKKRCVQLIGYVLIPVLLWVTYRFTDMAGINFTGVINRENGWIMKIGGLCLWAWFNVLLIPITRTLPHQKHWIAFMDLLAVLTMVIPYHTQADLLSNLHVLCANGTLFVFNYIVIFSSLHSLSKLRLYFMFVLPSFLLILTTMSINGLCETVYAWGISVYLTHANIKAHRER